MAKQPTDNRRRSRVPSLDVPQPADVRSASESPAPQTQLRGRPANENDPSSAMMLQRLRRPPSYDVIWASVVLSAIWAAGWFWVYKDVFANQQVSSPTEFLQALALLVLPVLGMVSIAYFQWRAQQLRQVSEVLMHQAMRLIRPQDIATDGLTSIAQAVRQEVDLLVGGVEHAFQRATALEEIVHKEISAIERAFGSNEDRIRGLVNGLETQRAALQQTSNMVASDAQPMLQRLESNTQNLGQVVNLALSTFGRLEDGLKTSTTELARTIENVSQRAAETGAEIGTHSTQFERLSTMLVSDFRGFSGQLQEYIQTLSFTASNLGNETRKFGSEVKGMEGNLIQVLQSSSDRLIGAHTEVAQTVERLASGANTNAKQTANELLQTFGSIGETISFQIKSATSDSLTQLERMNESVSNQVRAATAEHSGALERLGGGFENTMRLTTNAAAENIERVGLDTAKRIEQANGLVTSGLQLVSGDYLQKLNVARNELTAHLDQSAAKMVAELDSTSVRFNDRFLQTGNQLVVSLDQSSTNLVNQLGASGSGLLGSIQSSTEKYALVLTDASNRLDLSANAASTNISRTTTLLSQELQGVGTNINDLLVSTSGTIAAHLKETSEIVSRQMQDSGLALAQNIENSGGNVTDRLISVSGEFVQKLTTTRDGLLTAFLGASGDLTSKLQDTSTSIFTKLQFTNTSMSDQLADVAAQINDRLDGTITLSSQHVANATAKMIDASNAIHTRLNETTGEFHDRFSETSTTAHEHLDAASALMHARLNESAHAVQNRMHSTTSDLVDQLESVTNQLHDKFEGAIGLSSERIAAATDGLTTKLDASSTQLGSLLVATERRLGNQLEQASTELEALFNQNTKMLSEQLEQSSTAVTASFAETTVQAAQTLSSAGLEVTTKIDDASQTMFNRLHGTTAELGKRFDVATDHLELVTTEISKRLDGQGQRFVDILDQASGQIFTDLGKARDAFSEGLGETTMQISGRFEQETGLLVGRIDKAVLEFDTTATTSAGKLEEASQKFSKHVAGTSTFLTNQLATAASDIDTRLESVSMQLTGKLESTGTRISERLDDVSALVDKSIDKFNLEMEHVLQSRRDVLENLSTDASRKAAEVDKMMNGYIAMIEDSLTTAEQRAQHLGRIVSDQSNAALSRLEEELRKLETNSTGQVAQAARALREQHERALANMNEMLSSTASDFQQTAQDMRITAQQVVKDIDTARGELKRAVIDLPEETRTNADNMRRVVADQISALNALAEVVRKQSGSLDFSGPGFMSARSTPALAPRAEASYAPAAAIAAPVRVATPTRAEPATTTGSKIAALAHEVDTFNTKLNVSARDVVEAIEGQLPRDLEKRYSASDRGVYTTRLYETRSRKLIKALENRYAEERLLRSRIQAFNRLFEKLLDSISETDGAEAVMEEVLASEQGRIYVMLAEVAGRLPNQS